MEIDENPKRDPQQNVWKLMEIDENPVGAWARGRVGGVSARTACMGAWTAWARGRCGREPFFVRSKNWTAKGGRTAADLVGLRLSASLRLL